MLLRRLLIFALLTLLTQVGGVLYALSWAAYPLIKAPGVWTRRALKIVAFLLIYGLASWLLVPPLARHFGRVPLPVFEEKGLQPLTVGTCLLNRHYVRPALKEAALSVAEKMGKKHPGAVLNYLDANFPFFNGFPLVPHLSHSDGKKLDVAFCYDLKEGGLSSRAPSLIGYGICEEPRPSEENMGARCEAKGYWVYNLMSKLMPQGAKGDFVFSEKRTKEMSMLFAQHEAVGKLFIEPHLKKRLGLESPKFRFHGCQAVRHDDHLHVQLK